MKTFTLLTIGLLGLSSISFGQALQIQTPGNGMPGVPSSYTNMVQQLFGVGGTISNIQIKADTTAGQISWFDGSDTSLNVPHGILLTSGNVSYAVGPNTISGAGIANTLPGDPDLDVLAGVATFNAAVLEFDIVPNVDTLYFKYVFGSEEYMEFVGSFNDVFGFLVSGPNPNGGNYVGENIALIPGTTLPVAINNVNCGANGTYYICNEPVSGSCTNCPPSSASTTVQYDGFTVPLFAKIAVTVGQTYHFKLAVADALDEVLDSGIFLQDGAGITSGIFPNIKAGNSGSGTTVAVVEDCINSSLDIALPFAHTQDLTFHFSLGGTATQNIDYVANVSQVVIPAGQTQISIPIQILSDNIIEGNETIELTYNDSILYGTQMVYMNETITYTIQDKVNPDAGANVSMFSGATSPVGSAANPTSGYTYQWNPTIGLTNPTAPLTTISLTNTTSSNVDYVYTLTSFLDGTACEGQDTVTISVKPVVNGIEDAPFATLQLYPNPGKGGFMLESQSFQGQSVSIQLFNSIGQKVHATQDLLSDGKYEVRLVQPISGIYFVKISANSRTQIVKYIVE